MTVRSRSGPRRAAVTMAGRAMTRRPSASLPSASRLALACWLVLAPWLICVPPSLAQGPSSPTATPSGPSPSQAPSATVPAAPPATSVPASRPAPRYEYAPASPDGIGKRYLGREISFVMGWQGASWLERPERETEERTDLLLDALALRPGMVVADVGAGTGYLARRIAPRVAPGGKVVAVDLQPQMIGRLRAAARREGVDNLEARLGREDDAALEPSSIDLAVMVDVYHELALPYEMLASIVQALKPGGQLVFVEYRGEDPAVPIKALHKMTEAQIRREASVHPLVWEKTVSTLPWQHVVVFRRDQ